MNTNKWKRIIVFIMISSMAVSLAGCGAPSKGSMKELSAKDLIDPVAAHDASTKAIYGDVAVREVLDARVNPWVEYLSFDQSVTFGEYCVKIGDKVKKGDIIAKSYSVDMDNALKALREQLQGAKEKYNYEQTSRKNKLTILNCELQTINKDTAKDQYASKKAEINDLELMISQSTELEHLEEQHINEQIENNTQNDEAYMIKAPFDGEVVSLLYLNQGDPVTNVTKVVALANPKKPIIQTEFLEQNVVSKYQQIYALINGKEYDINYVPYDKAEYKSLTAAGENLIGRFGFSELQSNLMGSYAVVVMVKEEHKHVICIPNETISTDSAGKYVFRVEDGKRIRCDIEIGITDGVYTEVIKGINEGENIYLTENNSDSEPSEKAIVKEDFSKAFMGDATKLWSNEKVLTFDTKGSNVIFDSFAVKENDFVKAGAVIATVIPEKDDVLLLEKEFELRSLEKKLSELEHSYQENTKQKKNEAKNALTRMETDIKNLELDQLKVDYQYQKAECQTQIKTTKEDIQTMKSMANVTKITAKEDCIITHLGQLMKGDKIQPNALIAKTADADDFYIAVEDNDGLLNFGQKVTVIDGKKEISGTVVTTWNKSLPSKLQYNKTLIRVSKPKDVEHEVVSVKSPINQMSQVYMVNRDYLFQNDIYSYVKEISSDGNIIRRVILPGGYNDEYCWVVSGINGEMKLMKNTNK